MEKNMTREQVIREQRKIEKIVERFSGEVDFTGKTIRFDNPLKIETRADALDILFLLTLYDDWNCDFYEAHEALARFVKKLPNEKAQ